MSAHRRDAPGHWSRGVAGALAVLGVVVIGVGVARQSGPPPEPTAAAAGVLAAGTRGTPGPASGDATRPAGLPTPADSAGATSPAAADGQGTPTDPPVLAPSRPTRITIPSIKVDSGFVDLGLNPDNTVQVPARYDIAGWFDGSPTPGERGPSVILGHVDSTRGPGVFFRLGQLVPGDRVTVARADGSTATFAVTGVREYPKDDFPTIQVYGNTDDAALRLITCGGRFDRSTGHYVSNIIVFATLVTG